MYACIPLQYLAPRDALGRISYIEGLCTAYTALIILTIATVSTWTDWTPQSYALTKLFFWVGVGGGDSV
jgi:hypothetical protein